MPTTSLLLDHTLRFAPDPLVRLWEAHRALTPGGELVILDVFRKRTLPPDVANQPAVQACGFAGAPLLADLPRLLADAGFVDVEIINQPGALDDVIARYDAAAVTEAAPVTPVTDEEWIASTQACCGLSSPKSERLAEILKCDDVNALWAVVRIVARRL